MTKGKKIFAAAVLAVIVLIAALYVWNPVARKPATLAELVGIHAEFEQAYVTEIIGTSTINTYDINVEKSASMTSLKTFLKETEIEYVGRADKVLHFEGNTSYNVIFIDDDHRCEIRMDRTGAHIYFGGIEYTVKDSEDMVPFRTSLPGTASTAANRVKAYAEQLTDAAMEYLQVLKGRPAVVIGEYIEPVHKEYFDLLYASNRAAGTDISEEEVLEKIKEMQVVKQQAQEHGLEPSDEEIAMEVANQQAIAASDTEAQLMQELYIESLGISQKDYWEFYYPAQLRIALRKYSVEAYIEENNLQTIDEIMEGMNMEVVMYDERN
ncbi:MAG: hypothetical protein IJB73_05490 [Firmicutes bacterium]|nr:hypothetical protein [Bacillota bacterium]